MPRIIIEVADSVNIEEFAAHLRKQTGVLKVTPPQKPAIVKKEAAQDAADANKHKQLSLLDMVNQTTPVLKPVKKAAKSPTKPTSKQVQKEIINRKPKQKPLKKAAKPVKKTAKKGKR